MADSTLILELGRGLEINFKTLGSLHENELRLGL